MDFEALNVILAGRIIKEIKQSTGSSIDIITEDGSSIEFDGGGYQDRCGYHHDTLDVTVTNKLGSTIYAEGLETE